jgi:acyl-coenzyme A synthetase/AMP-(fatty) acid ligase
VLERELRALAPPGKVPHAVTFLTELPRTAAGKLRRIALRQA